MSTHALTYDPRLDGPSSHQPRHAEPAHGCVADSVHRAHVAAGDRRCDSDNPPHLDVKATGAAIRKALRKTWPGVKFSVRMSTGTGYGYFDAAWIDGPTEAQFRALTDGFSDAGFDGMTDSTTIVHRGTRYRSNGVNGQRRYSPAAKALAAEKIAAHPGLYDRPGDWVSAAGVNESAVHRVIATLDLSGPEPVEVSPW